MRGDWLMAVRCRLPVHMIKRRLDSASLKSSSSSVISIFVAETVTSIGPEGVVPEGGAHGVPAGLGLAPLATHSPKAVLGPESPYSSSSRCSSRHHSWVVCCTASARAAG